MTGAEQDHVTSTVDAAAAFERWRAEPEIDDDRPSLNDALHDDWLDSQDRNDQDVRDVEGP